MWGIADCLWFLVCSALHFPLFLRCLNLFIRFLGRKFTKLELIAKEPIIFFANFLSHHWGCICMCICIHACVHACMWMYACMLMYMHFLCFPRIFTDDHVNQLKSILSSQEIRKTPYFLRSSQHQGCFLLAPKCEFSVVFFFWITESSIGFPTETVFPITIRNSTMSNNQNKKSVSTTIIPHWKKTRFYGFSRPTTNFDGCWLPVSNVEKKIKQQVKCGHKMRGNKWNAGAKCGYNPHGLSCSAS